MIRQLLTLGGPLAVATTFLFTVPAVTWETKTAIFAVVMTGLSIELAHRATRQAARYGGRGMPVEMAAMMAAMGTGLSSGYAVGMVWPLGWANLVGVLAGLTHGLVMGRRYGPVAALQGAGGGVMGGLMGPMLGVMLVYAPVGLVLTALLMLALQAGLNVGGVYLVAASVGGVTPSGWLHRVGHVLGAQYQVDPCCSAQATVAARPSRSKKPHRGAPSPAPPRRSWLPASIAAVAGGLSLYVIVGGGVSSIFGASSPSVARPNSFASQAATQPVAATVGQDGVQQLTLSLRYPAYEPRLMEVKAGTPVRLTLEALGDPG